MGFGANHNQALKGAAEPFFCVLNPDVELVGKADPLMPLVELAGQPTVGCAYAQQIGEQGNPQDCERELPTLPALFRRRVLSRHETRTDWVNAACMVLSRDVWQRINGFDEAYFMYCEDVDLCLRIRLLHLSLARAPVAIVHAGQRASRRRLQHLAWHVQSLLRLWRSPVFWRARQLLQSNVTTGGRITPP
jgi:GT2 family glycosyltransferase